MENGPDLLTDPYIHIYRVVACTAHFLLQSQMELCFIAHIACWIITHLWDFLVSTNE